MDPIDRLKVSTYSRVPSSLERSFFGAFITKLIEARHARGLTIEELEHRLGVAAGAVAKWETYQRLPGAFMLCCWCNALDLNLTATALEIEEQRACPPPNPKNNSSDDAPPPATSTPRQAKPGRNTMRKASASKGTGARRKRKRNARAS